MRRILCAVAVLAFAAALGVPAFAETKTVKGEIIDVQCYMKKDTNVGDDHKNCGTSCAKKGAPLGVLAMEDGKPVVYTITGDWTAKKNEKLVPHFSHKVEVTGEVTEKDGKKMIAVKELKMQKTTS